jgi:hypothetical protein
VYVLAIIWKLYQKRKTCRKRTWVNSGPKSCLPISARTKSWIPVGPFVETAKTDGTRNPMHAVSYASVAAGKRKSNDHEEKSPLTTRLPSSPERHTEKGLAKLARKQEVEQTQKTRRTGSTPTKRKQLKAKTSSPLHNVWCCDCSKNAKCKTTRCPCFMAKRACTSGKCRDGCCERVGPT